MFECNQDETHVLADILLLTSRCQALIAVTIGEMEPGEFNAETLAFIAALAHLNKLLFDHSDIVYEMQGGTAVLRKGAVDDMAKIPLYRNWNL
ncbi:MAG: hypothetical protein R2912_08560 [Eubacteriales bacterium]